MAIAQLPQISGAINADSNATKNTIVLRDAQGNIVGSTITGSTLQTTGNHVGNVATQTTSFTAGAATHYLCDCTSGAITATLPLASANTGVVYFFMKKDSSGNAVTLSTVTGTGTMSTQFETLQVFSDGSNWYSGH